MVCTCRTPCESFRKSLAHLPVTSAFCLSFSAQNTLHDGNAPDTCAQQHRMHQRGFRTSRTAHSSAVPADDCRSWLRRPAFKSRDLHTLSVAVCQLSHNTHDHTIRLRTIIQQTFCMFGCVCAYSGHDHAFTTGQECHTCTCEPCAATPFATNAARPNLGQQNETSAHISTCDSNFAV